jgi:hypothetical protein
VATTFPFHQYRQRTEPFALFYPEHEEGLANWIAQTVSDGRQKLEAAFTRSLPTFTVIVVDMVDWHLVPHDEDEDVETPHPYMTNSTEPPSLVVPTEVDILFGEATSEKLAYMLYHELAVTSLESDPRPWPEDTPLWADEWQFQFVALWLAQTLNGVQGVVNKDIRQEYEEVFEVEPDGKTPVTIRGFDWYEDTTPEDYLAYELLLEQFAADLLQKDDIHLLVRFLDLYRKDHPTLLSDNITAMLTNVLGAGSEEWLENLIYF